MSTSETARHRHRVSQYCKGNGIDVGAAGDAITPRALSIDLATPYGAHWGQSQWEGDGTNLHWFRDGVLDYVYSSHLLEDFADWLPVLKEWARVIRPGGYLVILIPDKARWQAALNRGQPPNLAHKHEGQAGELSLAVQALGGRWHIILDALAEPEGTDYTILFVAQKLYGLETLTEEQAANLIPASGLQF